MRQFIKRFGGITLSTALVLSFLFMPDLAHAEGIGSNDALKNFSEIAATLVHIITAAAMLMIQFFPPLWGSELITGDQVTQMLRPMWIYVRNLTNIAFVGMILFLAFSNLVTSGKGIKDWNIKSKLGPVILGLVAINFSMMAVRVMVDVVHVGTVALLSIADPVIEARGINNVADYYSRKVDTETFEDCSDGGGANCKSVRELVNNTFCPPGGEACLFQIKKIEDIRTQAEGMNNPEKKNIMLAFGSFFMKLESLPLLSADTGGLLDVLDSAIFSLVFGLAYLLALAAMMIVLLVRVVMMWVFIIFSPLLVAGWVLGIGGMGKATEEFSKYLLVPLKSAAALAFGFVMIAQLQLMTIPSEFFVSVIEPGASLKSLWGPDEFGGWRMLWSIMTVVLFWKVVFDFALTGMPGAEAIKSFGEKAGSAALSYGADQVKLPGMGAEGKEMTLASFMGSGSINNRLAQATQAMRREAGSQSPLDAFRGGGEEREGRDKAGRIFTQQGRDLNGLRREIRQENLTTGELTAAMQDDAIRQRVLTTARQNGYNGPERDITAIVAHLDGLQGVEFKDTGADGATPPPTTTPVTVDSSTGDITINNGGTTIPIANTESRNATLTQLKTSPLDDAALQSVLNALKNRTGAAGDTWDDVDNLAELKAAIAAA